MRHAPETVLILQGRSSDQGLLHGVKEIEERYEIGKAIRGEVLRDLHAVWEPPSNRKDRIDILIGRTKGG